MKIRTFFFSFILALFFLSGVLPGSGRFCQEAQAAAWPAFDTELTAGSAVVYDVDTGTVLYGKDAFSQQSPASITKLLTALLVAENCPDLEEKVVFSASAVYGLESGAVTAGTSEGDELSVRDCLYALILHSANEVANALAEHVSGSIPAFCGLMNQRAAELGCRSTHFVNCNGLTSDEHLTSAYDMALIGAACMENPVIMELWKSESYTIGPTKRNPNGYTFSVGHKMLKKGSGYTDSRVVGGKTGFTTQSGNTLVTLAEDGGRRIAVVVMKDKNPQHYTDTKALLDFGFSQFETDDISDTLDFEELRRRFEADTVVDDGLNRIYAQGRALVTVPAGADLAELELHPDYNRRADWPPEAVCRLEFRYAGVTCGSVLLLNEHELSVDVETAPAKSEPDAGPKADPEALKNLMRLLIFLIIFTALLVPVLLFLRGRKREQQMEEERRKRRAERLKSINMTEEEFEHLVMERRKRHGHPDETSEEGSAEPEETKADGPQPEEAPVTEDAPPKAQAEEDSAETEEADEEAEP